MFSFLLAFSASDREPFFLTYLVHNASIFLFFMAPVVNHDDVPFPPPRLLSSIQDLHSADFIFCSVSRALSSFGRWLPFENLLHRNLNFRRSTCFFFPLFVCLVAPPFLNRHSHSFQLSFNNGSDSCTRASALEEPSPPAARHMFFPPTVVCL